MTILLALVIAGFIIFFTSRKITSPLREMNHSALQFAKGDFNHRVKIETKDEIGQLGETFNYMAQELASIDQMRKDFVANVSHDLRSPLTSIRGFLGALMDGTIPKEQQNKYLEIMKNETERLMKLVEDLLDMARLEANQIDINPVNYNVSEQLRLSIAKMEPLISQHEVDIELNGEDINVTADRDRMEQVINNLLQNAIQFSKKNSKIEVTIKKVGEEAEISIRDFGLGMDEEDLKYIWERFYKKEKARSTKGGTGIGLSIVKHIIDLHGTSIQVESELNYGTTFSFTLKLAEEQ
nr:HAMP domain-containing sensor histidine kinase [Evansella tamaricis]